MSLNRLVISHNVLKKVTTQCGRCMSTTTSASSNNEVKTRIEIPTRIERSPTAVLEALASTLERDFTAAHYKFHDDPFLTPMSNLAKRTYALSKESGRMAARYFLEKYPHLFYRDDAEPKIPRFSYSDSFTDATQVDESDLINCIACRQVANAVQVFQNCKSQKVTLSQEALQALLEMLCFNNSMEGPDTDFLEQSWYKQREDRSEKKKTWNDGASAEEVFQSMPEKTPQAINTMICGLGRFNAAEKAFKMYEDARGNNILLDTNTYNYILKAVSFLRGSGDSQWELILDILRDMSVTNTSPNLGTLNEILDTLSRLGTWRHAKNMALRTMAEMRGLGVEPSIGSYALILKIFSNDRTGGAAPHVLHDIMDQLEEKDIVIRHPKDVIFFASAMATANEPLADLDLAFRVHKLLLKGDNYKLIGDAVKESTYFQNLMRLLCTSETMNGIRDFYVKYVPSMYTPEPGVMAQLINAAEFHEAFDFLVFIWTDIISFEYTTREQVYKPFIRALANAKTKDKDIHEKFVNITSQFIEKINTAVAEEKYGAAVTVWSGETLSLCLKIFLNAGDLDKANDVLKKLSAEQNKIMGFADTEILQDYCHKLIEAGKTRSLVECCKYASDVGNDYVIKFVGEHLDKIPEEDNNRKRLIQVIQSIS